LQGKKAETRGKSKKAAEIKAKSERKERRKENGFDYLIF
jgi:hypothetical protein